MAESQEILLQKIKEQGDIVRKLKSAKESGEKVSKIIHYSLLISNSRLDVELHHVV